MNHVNKGIIFTAASGILYGSIGYFGAGLMAHGFSVPALLLWRFLVSAVLLLPAVMFAVARAKSLPIEFASLVRLFLFGAIFYGGGTAFYFESSKTIGTGLAMVIFFAYPIVVVLLSYLINKTSLTVITMSSLFLIVVGCVLIALGESIYIDIKGISFAVISGCAYGTYLFGSKQASHMISPVLAAFSVCLGSAAAFLLYSILIVGNFPVPQSLNAWVLVGLFSIVGTVLPVLFMLIGLKHISASKASIISVLEPVTTLGIGAFLLSETVTLLQFIGAGVILCSAVLVQLDKETAVSNI